MNIKMKKKYSGIFRDGGAGAQARSRFRKRRQRLMERENKLMVITGVPYGPGEETTWSYAYCPTYQEPSIMYLTGVNQSKVILLLDPSSRQSDEILFIPKKDPVKEFWDGIRFGVGDPKSLREAQKVTGIKDIRDIEDFESVLKERFGKQRKKQLGAFWLEGRVNGKRKIIEQDHNWKFRSRLAGLIKKWKAPKEALQNIMDTHFELRMPLDSYDCKNVLKAQKITANAFTSTLQNFSTFKNECQVQAYVEGQMLFHSPYGLSFPSIVASGPNATILHYMKNDDDFGKDEMVLIDFGVRWMTMHADISRTVPASGTFNPLQKMLYEIVLKAQLEVEKTAQEGVTIQQLNDVCWDSINHDLKTVFKEAGGKYKLKYTQRPHGVSHLMGEQEHDGDPFRMYSSKPMKDGWMISNEPGLYGDFKLKFGRKTYDATIGIRIEDNLLIKKKGCKNMSRVVPKTVEEIERWMSGNGNP